MMAIFGNIITACSWFGVNMLGVGLHSYGFMDQAFYALTAFIASQVVSWAYATRLPGSGWESRTEKLDSIPLSKSGSRNREAVLEQRNGDRKVNQA